MATIAQLYQMKIDEVMKWMTTANDLHMKNIALEEDVKALHKALNSVLALFVSQHGYEFNAVDAGLEALARNSERLPVTAAFEQRIAAIRKEEELL